MRVSIEGDKIKRKMSKLTGGLRSGWVNIGIPMRL